MPSGSYLQVNVACPFYKYDDGNRRITCEGIVDGGTIVLNYKTRADRQKQLNVFCSGKYENCEIFRMLMKEKYEEC